MIFETRIVQDRRDELVIFFSGWGMDRAATKLIDFGDRDVAQCYDYRELSWPGDIRSYATRYSKIHLVAWSMGVAFAARMCEELTDLFALKLAAGGSIPGIDDAYGIQVDAYQATIDGMTEKGRSRFHRRITEDRQLQATLDDTNGRSLEDVQEELVAIRDHLAAQPQAESFFDVALIGGRDRIFPPENLQNYWQGRANIHFADDMPHMPLASKISIGELIGNYG